EGHAPGGTPLRPPPRDARLDRLAVGETEVDDDLADHPLRAPRVARRAHARLVLLGRGRLAPPRPRRTATPPIIRCARPGWPGGYRPFCSCSAACRSFARRSSTASSGAA